MSDREEVGLAKRWREAHLTVSIGLGLGFRVGLRLADLTVSIGRRCGVVAEKMAVSGDTRVVVAAAGVWREATTRKPHTCASKPRRRHKR